MGRNNHNKIRNGHFKSKHFNLKEIQKEVSRIQGQEAVVLLNMVLLTFPWAVLFAMGVLA